ncbi:hypothetical protein BH09PLA1_BH09PLA1_04990 [soil metagenome]
MREPADEFFVGYLPVPMRLRTFLRAAMLLLIVIAGVGAALIASGQRDPGTGKWDLDDPSETIGVIGEAPYPVLRTASATILLIDQGKVGAVDRVKGLQGRTVKIRGTRIERESVRLIELAEDPGAIQTIDGETTADPIVTTDGATIVLRGEIVDPKCHSGAMKPGDGKTHKACATLCIRGGIPPVLIDDAQRRFLLVDHAGGALTGESLDAILPFVGDRVEVSGVIQRQGDLVMLLIDSAHLHRLTP